jgi:hypothetical protein
MTCVFSGPLTRSCRAFKTYLKMSFMLQENLAALLYRSRIHERTISLSFLGIILRNLRLLSFCMEHRKGGLVFYQVFLLSPLQCTVTEL